jgi:hypothetical protein
LDPSTVLREVKNLSGSRQGLQDPALPAPPSTKPSVQPSVQPSTQPSVQPSTLPTLPTLPTLSSTLILWCDTIVSKYGLYVHNLTTSLADGRALCLVVNHYHPTLLPVESINSTTTGLVPGLTGLGINLSDCERRKCSESRACERGRSNEREKNSEKGLKSESFFTGLQKGRD